MFDNLYGLFFRYSSFLINFGLEGFAIAILKYHYFKVFITIDIKAFHEIWTIA